jgi:hypothetical protein
LGEFIDLIGLPEIQELEQRYEENEAGAPR